jgi:hypothetical protein
MPHFVAECHGDLTSADGTGQEYPARGRFRSRLATYRSPRSTWCKLALGIGLEVKYTIGDLAAAIGIAILLTPALRSDLRTWYPWIAVGIALLIWAPNLAWQVERGFPSLVYIAIIRARAAALSLTRC